MRCAATGDDVYSTVTCHIRGDQIFGCHAAGIDQMFLPLRARVIGRIVDLDSVDLGRIAMAKDDLARPVLIRLRGPRALRTQGNVLAVLRCRPDGSVIFSPDGNGAFWSDEHVYYRPGGGVEHAGMQDMALIGPHTILVADVVRKEGWRVEEVPITVRAQAAKD